MRLRLDPAVASQLLVTMRLRASLARSSQLLSWLCALHVTFGVACLEGWLRLLAHWLAASGTMHARAVCRPGLRGAPGRGLAASVSGDLAGGGGVHSLATPSPGCQGVEDASKVHPLLLHNELSCALPRSRHPGSAELGSARPPPARLTLPCLVCREAAAAGHHRAAPVRVCGGCGGRPARLHLQASAAVLLPPTPMPRVHSTTHPAGAPRVHSGTPNPDQVSPRAHASQASACPILTAASSWHGQPRS
jgi:hypothetical protein